MFEKTSAKYYFRLPRKFFNIISVTVALRQSTARSFRLTSKFANNFEIDLLIYYGISHC